MARTVLCRFAIARVRRISTVLAAFTLLAAPASGGAAPENRCGILSNPTPANWWLTDRDGEWIIGVQGGHQAEGMEAMPETLFEDGWVRTNGYYGFRCACLKVDTDRETGRIRRIHGARALPMRRCDSDRKLQDALSRRP